MLHGSEKNEGYVTSVTDSIMFTYYPKIGKQIKDEAGLAKRSLTGINRFLVIRTRRKGQ